MHRLTSAYFGLRSQASTDVGPLSPIYALVCWRAARGQAGCRIGLTMWRTPAAWSSNITKLVRTPPLRPASASPTAEPGRLVEGGWSPCSATSPNGSHPNYSALRPTVDEVPEDGPFFNKTLVFTGTLDYFVRNEAAQHVVNVGGRVSNSISRKVDYLVCGAQDARLVRDGVHSSQMLKAMELRGQGAPIELITDGDFYRMLWQ
jgi:hypothetical protein